MPDRLVDVRFCAGLRAWPMSGTCTEHYHERRRAGMSGRCPQGGRVAIGADGRRALGIMPLDRHRFPPMQQPAFLSGLNPEQLEAVTLPGQSALILAGAGSGKTRVLTTRIAWLISTGQATPASILAVTFTNKAAKEMLARVAAMLPINMRGMWIGTFHGLCNRMLRAHFREAGLPQVFQILDTQDQQAAIKRLMKAMKVNDEKFPPRQVQWFINAAKEEGKRAREVDAYDDYARRMTEIFAAYDEQCNREGVVDFPELLLRCFELLQRNELLRDHYRARFKHILVDEFQDTNVLQYRWLKLLAGDGAACPRVLRWPHPAHRHRLRRTARSSRSATTTSRSTLSAAPMSPTCSTSSATSMSSASSSWSRTTVRTAISWKRPTP
jgi:hypothetical protein